MNSLEKRIKVFDRGGAEGMNYPLCLKQGKVICEEHRDREPTWG